MRSPCWSFIKVMKRPFPCCFRLFSSSSPPSPPSLSSVSSPSYTSAWPLSELCDSFAQHFEVEAGHFFTYLWALEGTSQGDQLRASLQISWEELLGREPPWINQWLSWIIMDHHGKWGCLRQKPPRFWGEPLTKSQGRTSTFLPHEVRNRTPSSIKICRTLLYLQVNPARTTQP